MQSRFSRRVFGVLLLSCSGIALADDSLSNLFSPTSMDISLNYLRMIFGTVGNALIGTGDQLIAKLFNIFNMGLLTFAGGFVSYTVFRSVINTAQDGGGAAGQGKGNAWPTFRIVLGVSLLMPMYQGYSMAQVTVMWSVVQGVGLADTMWKTAVDEIANTGGALLSPPSSSLYADLPKISGSDWSPTVANDDNKSSMTDLMASATCLAVLDHTIADYKKANQTSFNGVSSAITPAIRLGADCQPRDPNDLSRKIGAKPDDKTICFGVRTRPAICGQYTWAGSNLSSVSANVQGLALQTATNYYSMMRMSLNNAINFLDQYKTGDDDLNFNTNADAQAALNGSEPPLFLCKASDKRACYQGLGLASSATQYYSQVKSARENPPAADSPLKKWASNAGSVGWMAAGQSYHELVSTPNQAPSILRPLNGYLMVSSPAIQSITKDNINTYGSNFGTFLKNTTGEHACIFANPPASVKAPGNSTDIHYYGLGPGISAVTGGLGNLTVDAGSKLGVAACLLSSSLQRYAAKAAVKFQNVQAASLGNKLGGNTTTQTTDSAGKTTESTSINAPTEANEGSVAYAANNLIAQSLNIFFGANGKQNYFSSGTYQIEASGAAFNLRTFILAVPQDNLRSMIYNVMGQMLGFYPFQANTNGKSLPATFSDGSANASGKPFKLAYAANCVGLLGDKGACTAVDGKVPNGCFKAAVDANCIQKGQGILGSMATAQLGQRTDQLLVLGTLGTAMMDNAVLYWTKTTSGVYLVAKSMAQAVQTASLELGSIAGGAAGLAVGVGSGLAAMMNPVGAALTGIGQMGLIIVNSFLKVWQLDYQFAMTSLAIYMPFGTALALLFFTIGVSLGLYVPLIPFLTFLFSAIGWMIAVIEAMIAAPLVALGVTHPEGHDLLGKAEQSIILLLGIFVRPAAMLLGFIMAIVLTYVAMEMLNTGFASVIVGYLTSQIDLADSSAGLTKLIGLSGVLLVYAYTTITVVNQAFSLIYQVPEKLLRWIGAAPEQSGVSQMMQEVKGGTKDAAGQVGQGASQTAQSAPQLSPGSLDAHQWQKVEGGDKSEGST